MCRPLSIVLNLLRSTTIWTLTSSESLPSPGLSPEWPPPSPPSHHPVLSVWRRPAAVAAHSPSAGYCCCSELREPFSPGSLSHCKSHNVGGRSQVMWNWQTSDREAVEDSSIRGQGVSLLLHTLPVFLQVLPLPLSSVPLSDQRLVLLLRGPSRRICLWKLLPRLL